MPDFSGPVQPVAVTHLLVLLLVVPLGAALVHLFKPSTAENDGKIARQGAALTALGAVGLLAMIAAQRSGERFFFQHVLRWVRAGELDANFDLAGDLVSGAMVLVAAGLAALAAASNAPAGRNAVAGASADAGKRAGRGTAKPAMLLLAAVTFAILAGDLSGTTLGLLLVAAASARIVGRARSIAFAGVATFAVASALLFWGTGGEWRRDGYGSDFRARLAAVAVGSGGVEAQMTEPAPRGQGLLTVTAYPGSPIFLDDSRTPLERDGDRLYTPVARLALPGGTHSIRIHPGMGEDDQLVAQLAMGEGRELALVPIGSTLSPRALDDELSLVDSSGAMSWRSTYLARHFSGAMKSLRVAPVTAWLFILAALLQALAAAASARDGLSRDAAKLATLSAIPAVYILLRLRASLTLSVPAAVVYIAVAVVAGLALVPLLLKREPRDAASNASEAADTTGAPSAVDTVTSRVASWSHALEARFGSDRTADAGAARWPRVDAIFAGVVLLFILAVVVSR